MLLRKDPVECEVYNDLDERVVNVFRVLRDPVMARRLAGLLALTPYSRAEYERAWDDPRSEDLVEDARRTILINQMGFGSAGLMPGQTAATFQSRCVSKSPAKPWATYHSHVELFCKRLQNVVIECRPAIDVLKQQDSPDTLHYVDPPYVMLARCERPRTSYLHEMTDDDHRELAEVLHSLKGMVVLSGYRSELYDELFADWPYARRRSLALCNAPREERLWLSPRAVERLGSRWEMLRARGY